MHIFNSVLELAALFFFSRDSSFRSVNAGNREQKEDSSPWNFDLTRGIILSTPSGEDRRHQAVTIMYSLRGSSREAMNADRVRVNSPDGGG